MLLFKDSIRLFAAYNEGIINLLGRSKFNSEFSLSINSKGLYMKHLSSGGFVMSCCLLSSHRKVLWYEESTVQRGSGYLQEIPHPNDSHFRVPQSGRGEILICCSRSESASLGSAVCNIRSSHLTAGGNRSWRHTGSVPGTITLLILASFILLALATVLSVFRTVLFSYFYKCTIFTC